MSRPVWVLGSRRRPITSRRGEGGSTYVRLTAPTGPPGRLRISKPTANEPATRTSTRDGGASILTVSQCCVGVDVCPAYFLFLLSALFFLYAGRRSGRVATLLEGSPTHKPTYANGINGADEASRQKRPPLIIRATLKY